MSKPDFAVTMAAGVEHFNAGRFWEAHESWEQLWLAAESDVDQFIQGLIQVAAAYHHVKRGTLRGAVRLFAAGLGRLARFPAGYCGIDRSAVETSAHTHAKWAERILSEGVMCGTADRPPYPTLNVSKWIVPPVDAW